MRKIIALTIALIMLAVSLVGCAGNSVSYKNHLDEYVKTMDYRDGFTILQMTDIHWSNGTDIGDDENGSIRYIKKVVAEAQKHAGKIDLIEITGDTFMLTNKLAVTKFIDLMDEIGIPYAILWGNHDRECSYHPDWLYEQFRKAPNSLYTQVDNDDVHNEGNYIINLKDSSGKVVWQLAQIDSGASYRNGGAEFFIDHDYIRDDQIEWLKAEHQAVGDDVPVLCYFHIPQADLINAFNNYYDGVSGYKAKYFQYEKLSGSSASSDHHETFKSLNVKGVFVGHDHANDMTVTTPDGIVYGFGVKTGIELYSANAKPGEQECGFEFDTEFKLAGASLVTLKNTDGDFELEHLYLNERDEGDFVLWVAYDD